MGGRTATWRAVRSTPLFVSLAGLALLGGTGVGCVSSQRPSVATDAGTVDAGGVDVNPGDTGSGDTGSPACAENSARCRVNTVQHCEDGVWKDVVVCPDSFPCSFGQCSGVDTGCEGYECGLNGQGVSCGTCEAGSTCVAGHCVREDCTPDCTTVECGDDGCGGQCGYCDGGLTCQGGLCVPGGLTCKDVLYCSFACTDKLDDQNACISDCANMASGSVWSDFADAGTCLDSCGSAATPADCVIADCSAAVAACMYPNSGTKFCAQVAQCAFECEDSASPGGPSSDECVASCAEEGLPAEQVKFAALELCLTLKCAAGTPSQSELCVQQAMAGKGPCGEPFNQCLGIAVAPQ